jgi:hypothetical protein
MTRRCASSSVYSPASEPPDRPFSKTEHRNTVTQCPLYPQKRTLELARVTLQRSSSGSLAMLAANAKSVDIYQMTN